MNTSPKLLENTTMTIDHPDMRILRARRWAISRSLGRATRDRCSLIQSR